MILGSALYMDLYNAVHFKNRYLENLCKFYVNQRFTPIPEKNNYMQFKDIIGKTIKDAYAFEGILKGDQWARLVFEDGSSCVLEGIGIEDPGSDCKVCIYPDLYLEEYGPGYRLPDGPNQ